jgi:sugar lactone lactonase YvrE
MIAHEASSCRAAFTSSAQLISDLGRQLISRVFRQGKIRVCTTLLISALPSSVSLLHADLIPTGTLFMGDVHDHIIYTFSPDGSRTPFAVGNNQFWPTGLAFDNTGNLFVADFPRGNVIRITPSGVSSIFASGLGFPLDLTVDSIGNLFVSDFRNGAIYRLTPSGVRTTFATGFFATGLALDSAGNLFAGDDANGNIFKFTASGVRTTFASGLNHPLDLTFDNSGNLFEADQGTGTIYSFTPDGSRSTFASSLGDLAGLAFDSADTLFVADLAHFVYAFSPDGSRSTLADGLNAPFSLAFNPLPFSRGPFSLENLTFVPESTSTLNLFGISLILILVFRRRRPA